MANQNTAVQYSFSTGEVMPGIHNRKDWARSDAAIAKGLNGTVQPTGAFRKRPGMRYLNDCLHDDKPITQVTFEFSKSQVYELEFGDYVMRFYTGRGMILNDDGTPYELETPFSAQQATEFTYAQERDAMFFAHMDMPLKVLTRHAHNRWVWSNVFRAKEEGAERITAPEALRWYDIAGDGHNGFEYAVTSYKVVDGTPQESIGGYPTIASDPATIDFIGEAPAENIQSCILWLNKYRPKYGRLPGFPADVAITNTFDLSGITEDGDPGNRAFLHPKIFAVWKLRYPSARYGYRGEYYTQTSTHERFRWYWGVYTGNPYPYPPGENALWYTYYGQFNSYSDNTFAVYPEYETTVANYNNTWFMLKTAIDWINNNQVAVNGWTKDSIYKAIIKFIEDFNAANSAKVFNHIAWPAVDGANGYYVYRRPMGADDKRFYLIGTVTDVGVTDFIDEDVSETIPSTQSPITTEIDFDSPDNYPALVTFFQQRLILGCTKNKPTTLWGSRTGIYTDYAMKPGDVSGPYEFKMASQQSNPLEWIIPLYTLVVLTSGGDFVSTVGGAMNESNVNFNQKSYNGCSDVKPIIVGDSGIYVPLNQQTINAMAYSYEKDGFSHQNILFQAQHFSKNKRVIQLAYQRDPINLIWALFDDGTLAACTYIPQQDFLAWSRIETAGRVKSINIVPTEYGNDELYLVVEREKGDGTKKQYLEVLEDMRPYGPTPDAANSFFVDCGLSGTFLTPVKTISGLDHLEGREVAVLADNGVQRRKTVTDGGITLDYPAANVHVGLPYEYDLKTLNFDIVTMGTLRNTSSSVHECIVEVEDTRELLYSASGGEECELVVHVVDDMGEPQLVTGDQKIYMDGADLRGANLRFRSVNPVPCTVCSLVLEVRHGDS